MSTLGVRLYDGNYDALASEDHARRFLHALPKAIGMKAITDAHVITWYPKKPEDWGVTGFIIFAESHAAIHAWPERLFARIEISSCESFIPYDALQCIRRIYGDDCQLMPGDPDPWHLPPVRVEAQAR